MAKRRSAKAPTDPVINPPEEPVVDVPEKAPTDPTLDPVPDEPVDVIDPVIEAPVDYVADQIAQARAREEALAPPAPPGPLDPVRVRNLGRRGWCGSDFAAVGSGNVDAGRVGTVTRKKAEQLLAGQHVGAGRGIGPFELVEE